MLLGGSLLSSTRSTRGVFNDSNGDGIGDLNGIIGRLDYLQATRRRRDLADTGLRSPQADNGYDISDYRDIDPMFGTMADIDALLAEAHELGMKLVMDLVVNHTSDEHAWFVRSRGHRRTTRTATTTSGGTPRDGGPPNNWASIFGGTAWAVRRGDRPVLPAPVRPQSQPDLNWENPEVREASTR